MAGGGGGEGAAGQGGGAAEVGGVVPVDEGVGAAAVAVGQVDGQAVHGAAAGLCIAGDEVVFAQAQFQLRAIGTVGDEVAGGVLAIPGDLVGAGRDTAQQQYVIGPVDAVAVGVDGDGVGAGHVTGEFEPAAVLYAGGGAGGEGIVLAGVVEEAEVADHRRLGGAWQGYRRVAEVDGIEGRDRVVGFLDAVARTGGVHAFFVGDDVVDETGKTVEVQAPDVVGRRSPARHQGIEIGIGGAALGEGSGVEGPDLRPQAAAGEGGVGIGACVRGDGDVEAAQDIEIAAAEAGIVQPQFVGASLGGGVANGIGERRGEGVVAGHIAGAPGSVLHQGAIGGVDTGAHVVGIDIAAQRDIDDFAGRKDVHIEWISRAAVFLERLVEASLIAAFGVSEVTGKYCRDGKSSCGDLAHMHSKFPFQGYISNDERLSRLMPGS